MGIKKQMGTAKGTRLKTLKQKALQVLRRRKMYDQQLGHVMNQQFNVDQVAFAQESIQDTINTVTAMKAANVQQKQMMKQIDLDDMAEMLADQEEINECMGRNYNCEFDETELLGELDELDEELAAEQLDEGLGMPSYVPNSQKADGNANAADAQP